MGSPFGSTTPHISAWRLAWPPTRARQTVGQTVQRKPVTRSVPGFRQTSVRQHRRKAAKPVRQTAMTHGIPRHNNHLPTDCVWEDGGEGGIRTPDTLASMPHFECGAFNHSATSPQGGRASARGIRSGRLRTLDGVRAYPHGKPTGSCRGPDLAMAKWPEFLPLCLDSQACFG
jgi:hypothetical protein